MLKTVATILLIFTTWANADNIVSIRGAVNFPGDYSLSDKEGILDILNKAGGLSKCLHPLSCEENALHDFTIYRESGPYGELTIHGICLQEIIDSRKTIGLKNKDDLVISGIAYEKYIFEPFQDEPSITLDEYDSILKETTATIEGYLRIKKEGVVDISSISSSDGLVTKIYPVTEEMVAILVKEDSGKESLLPEAPMASLAFDGANIIVTNTLDNHRIYRRILEDVRKELKENAD